MLSRIGRIAESVLVAMAWTAAILGISLSLLTLPAYTSAAVRVLGITETSGLPSAAAIDLAQDVRGLVADLRYEALPDSYGGRPAFDQRAVSHLLDVRRVIAAARTATGLASLLLAAWLALGVGLKRWGALRAGMRWGAVSTIVAVASIAVVGLTDFSWFFTAFHGVFFSSGTWTFPSDSLLIRLFPERFWMAAGAAWAVLALTGAGVLGWAARFARGDERRKVASPEPEDV